MFHAPGGAVAQLGERLNGIQEVDGSIPFGSTNRISNLAAAANPGARHWFARGLHTGQHSPPTIGLASPEPGDRRPGSGPVPLRGLVLAPVGRRAVQEIA